MGEIISPATGTAAQRSSVHLRPVLPTALLSDSVGEFGQYPGNGLKTQRAPASDWRSSPSLFFNCYLTNLKFALCSVPSFNLTLSWRQVPAQALLVFHI